MRRHAGLVIVPMIALLVATLAAQPPRAWTFDAMPAGAPPEGFQFASFRQPDPGRWSVVGASSRALIHSPASDDGWSLALAPGDPLDDVRVTARVRASHGPKTAGLIWDYLDAEHFSAVVLDLDEGEIELFSIWNGNRARLADREGLELDADAWHTIKVTRQGGRTTVSIGGIRVIDRIERRRTPPKGGRAGVVSVGSTGAAFDDLRIESARGGRS